MTFSFLCHENELEFINHFYFQHLDQSLANMRLTILNFAQRHINTPNCCVEALKTLISIFDFGEILFCVLLVSNRHTEIRFLFLNFPEEHVSTNNFELSELNHSLMEILTGNDFKPNIVSFSLITLLFHFQ